MSTTQSIELAADEFAITLLNETRFATSLVVVVLVVVLRRTGKLTGYNYPHL